MEEESAGTAGRIEKPEPHSHGESTEEYKQHCPDTVSLRPHICFRKEQIGPPTARRLEERTHINPITGPHALQWTINTITVGILT